jgi:hypothetical protein
MRRVTFFAGVVFVAAAASASGQVIVYSNTATQGAQAFQNGGAVNQSGNTITRYVADDITPIAGAAGQSVTQFTLSVANLNTTPVTARPRIRFFLPDGPGQAPGTGLATLNFAPATFAGSSISLIVSGTLSPGQFVIPSSPFFWAGVVFDDNGGTTGATQAQLNLLGQGAFNPPTVGSSVDIFFLSTAAGVPGDNPGGNLQNFGGNPVANFGWQFQVAAVPEPGTLMLLVGPSAIALLAHVRRRGKV